MTDIAAILNGYFAGGGAPANLYLGLVSATGFVQFDHVNDTMASHAGWTEFSSYSESNRQRWIPGMVTGNYPAQVNNPGKALVTPTALDQIVGCFLCDNNTKGGTSGQLYGPWYFEEGTRDTIIGAPSAWKLQINLRSNTPQVS